MDILFGPIAWQINVLYESLMEWTWHHSKLAVEEVSFFGGLRVVLLQLSSLCTIEQWALQLECDAPVPPGSQFESDIADKP